jgi:hypothetical protein
MSPQMKSMEAVRQLSGAELSLAARLAYVALLLVSAGMTTVVVSLWATEAALPLRTQMAFGVMSVIGATWAAFAVWVLRARRPLFARDRVIAGRLAVTFTTLFLAGGLAAVVIANSGAAYGVLATGAVMWIIAFHVLRQARRRFEELSARRAALAA